RFRDIAGQVLDFLGDGSLIAHNAPFDFAFLNAEFAQLDLRLLDPARMVDTLSLAKARFPGLPNSLDALCRRFSIDLSARTTHNALLDCRLLAEVYIELTGGRQQGFALQIEERAAAPVTYVFDRLRVVRPIAPSAEELTAHATFISRLSEAIWLSH
ncbi:MAG: exonuclease domain-containing protein, partial [Acetobacteraceae bacterium]